MENITKGVRRFILFSLLVLLFACDPEGNSKEGAGGNDREKIRVVTTIAQIGEPLSVIGGDKVQVTSLMGPSVDPHLYNATHGDMEFIDKAELIFYNGLNLEANLVEIFEKIGETKPVLAVGETIPEEMLICDEEGNIDPHIWFDIDLWEQAIGAAVEELKKYAPEYADEFEKNKQDYFPDWKS